MAFIPVDGNELFHRQLGMGLLRGSQGVPVPRRGHQRRRLFAVTTDQLSAVWAEGNVAYMTRVAFAA